jgi:hypothetical protein
VCCIAGAPYQAPSVEIRLVATNRPSLRALVGIPYDIFSSRKKRSIKDLQRENFVRCRKSLQRCGSNEDLFSLKALAISLSHLKLRNFSSDGIVRALKARPLWRTKA